MAGRECQRQMERRKRREKERQRFGGVEVIRLESGMVSQ